MKRIGLTGVLGVKSITYEKGRGGDSYSRRKDRGHTWWPFCLGLECLPWLVKSVVGNRRF